MYIYLSKCFKMYKCVLVNFVVKQEYLTGEVHLPSIKAPDALVPLKGKELVGGLIWNL